MSTTVTTADNALRARLDTVASGSTWGAETIGYLSQAQQQVVADLHDSMFSDGSLTGTNPTAINPTPSQKVKLISRASDSLRVLYVTHNDGTVTRGARRLDSPEHIYNRAALAVGYASPAQGGAFYALSASYIVVFPAIIGDTITENYLKIPTTLTTGGQSFEVPDWLVPTVITYALYLCCLQVKNTAEADRAMAEYRNQVVSWYKSFKLDPPPKFLPVPEKN